jgi:cytochrome P450 family 135
MNAEPIPNLPPGPSTPKLWQLARVQHDFVGYLNECSARFGPVFTLRVHPYDHLIIATKPEDLKTIYQRLPERFMPTMAPALVLGPILGSTSMFMATGSMHRRQRKLIRPALRGGLVSRWSERMKALADEELNRLPTGEPVGMRQPMRDITLSVICRLVFGVDSPERFNALRADISGGIDPRLALLLWFPSLWHRDGRLNPLRNLRRRRQMLLRMMREQIQIHRADPTLEDRDDALALMIRARDNEGNALGDEELCDQLLTLLAAGNESTAVALAWALERLSRAPAALERLTAELEEGREEYLDAVIKETLRTRAPVLDAIRTTTEEIELGGYRIPLGTMVISGFTVTHHSQEVWGDPFVFRPERFIEGDVHPYAFTPFGGGVRRCLGASLGELEMRIVLKEMLARYRVSPAPGPDEKIKLVGLTLVPAKGARIILEPRTSS